MTETLYCANHPGRETSLRCNRCEKLICAKCAVHMPTGYRCKECVNEQKKVFENALWLDYIIGFVTAAFLSAIASVVVGLISNWFYGLAVLFFSPFAATMIVRGAQTTTRRRRSRNLFIIIAVGVIIGGLPSLLIRLVPFIFMLGTPGLENTFSIWWLLPVIWQTVYLFIATPAVYAGLSGFTLR
ncbi:MAG: B-box zinc finger protein [Anaerolineae bacterium]|nr:B-box zinc finger protein [Anaerolineae bacterium]